MANDISSYSSFSSPNVVNPIGYINNFIFINVAAQAPLKLNPSNYTSWRAQFNSLLIGYDPMGYLDGTLPCPSPILKENEKEVINPNYSPWIRQDQLLFSAILASLSTNVIPFVTSAKSSKAAWDTLATMYAKPSHGRLMGIIKKLSQVIKDSKSVTDYMQTVKSLADELALIDALLQSQYLIFHVLNGLGYDFKEIVVVVHAHEN